MEDKEKPGKRSVAVALQYEHGKDSAPKVTAKGYGAVADSIVASAEKHGVAIEHNAFLAEALAKVELDQHVPRDLYRAVAEVIGFVLRLSGPASPTRK
ncbi:MAG: EscU/YscU/HrcU family type III secretion system export apparatus switch protein [Rhodomicrobiaceae bacterium]